MCAIATDSVPLLFSIDLRPVATLLGMVQKRAEELLNS